MNAGLDCICIVFNNKVSLKLASRDQSHVQGLFHKKAGIVFSNKIEFKRKVQGAF